MSEYLNERSIIEAVWTATFLSAIDLPKGTKLKGTKDGIVITIPTGERALLTILEPEDDE